MENERQTEAEGGNPDNAALLSSPPLTLYFYHPDHLGTSTFLTDAGGELYQFFLNLPFGETMAEQHSLTEDYETPYKFNGKELDSETGFYYYGARYYDPRASIWLSTDPLMEKYPNVNPYVYCVQNPINLIDPTGMSVEDNDYGINKSTGEITLLRTNSNQNDRLIEIRNGKETNNIVDDIAPGILKDGMNFKNDYNLIEVGGANQPTEKQFKEFIVKYGNADFVGKEISGYAIGYGYTDKIDAFLVEPHKNNSYTSCYSLPFDKNQQIQNFKPLAHLSDGKKHLYAKQHFHVHPWTGIDIKNPSLDDYKRAKDRNIDHHLYYWDFDYQKLEDKKYKTYSPKF